MRSFWYHRPDEDHPPPLVRHPDEIGESDRLAVAPFAPDLTSSGRRALLREWCSALDSLSGVRLLWVTSRVPQALFEAACRVEGLEGLWIKHSAIRSLEAVAEANALRFFHLGSSTALESIAPLESCQRLRVLGLENIKRISRLDELRSLHSLEELSVQGSMWTTQRVETLEPVGALSELRYLSIVNLRSADKTLRPLFKLRKLECFYSALWWDQAELDELRAVNPKLQDGREGENLAS